MQRLTGVGVLSLGKVMGMTGALLGLIIAIPYGLIIIAISLIGGRSAGAGVMGLGIGSAIAIMIFAPIMYALLLFIFGLIYGLVLNLVLSLAGGLELTIQQG